MALIKCDKCDHVFSPESIYILERTIDNDRGVREQYFRCPKCKAKYTTLVTDPEVRRLIKAGKNEEAAQAAQALRTRYTTS